MTLATIKLIEAVERLNMTGEIGDGTVANLHELATLARLEVGPHVGFLEWARELVRKPEPISIAGVLSAEALDTLRECIARREKVIFEREGVQSFQPLDGPIHVTLPRNDPLPRGVGPGSGGERYAAPSACPHPVEWVYKVPETFGAVKCEKCGFTWTP